MLFQPTATVQDVQRELVDFEPFAQIRGEVVILQRKDVLCWYLQPC